MSAAVARGRRRRLLGCLVVFTAVSWTALGGLAVAQEQRMTVGVAKVKCLRIKRAVERHEVVTEPSDIARGHFDTDRNRLCVEGLQRGNATVRFSGTYRRIVVGSELREEARPFAHTLQVRVLPPAADVKTVPKRFVVERGKPRRVQLSVFMTPTFARRSDENEKWRALAVAVDRAGVIDVKTLDDRGRMLVQFTAVKPGQVQVRLTGERRVRSDWQEVVRIVDVQVP